jgi:hypothetical protein
MSMRSTPTAGPPPLGDLTVAVAASPLYACGNARRGALAGSLLASLPSRKLALVSARLASSRNLPLAATAATSPLLWGEWLAGEHSTGHLPRLPLARSAFSLLARLPKFDAMHTTVCWLLADKWAPQLRRGTRGRCVARFPPTAAVRRMGTGRRLGGVSKQSREPSQDRISETQNQSTSADEAHASEKTQRRIIGSSSRGTQEIQRIQKNRVSGSNKFVKELNTRAAPGLSPCVT